MQTAVSDEQFLLKQSITRSELRIQENRPKLIDLVIANLHSQQVFIELSDPTVFILEKIGEESRFLNASRLS